MSEAMPTHAVREIYLWLLCAQRGLAALEAGVVHSFDSASFVPLNGVVNAGQAGDLMLAVPACPMGESLDHLLGYWVVWDDGGAICLAPSATNGILAAVDCDPDHPSSWSDPHVVGFSSDGTTPCEIGDNGCGPGGPVSLELSQLSADVEDRSVIVSWLTSAEVDHDGFHVYRATAFAGAYARLTADLVRGKTPYAYEDDRVDGGTTYFYKVGAVDLAGHEDLYGPVPVTTPVWTPLTTVLGWSRPNPFTDRSEIRFSLDVPGPVSLSVYDVTGRLVRRLVDDDHFPAAEHSIPWDGRDDEGKRVLSGVYFYRLEVDGVSRTRKMVYLGGE
jgi:hypothetical protein